MRFLLSPFAGDFAREGLFFFASFFCGLFFGLFFCFFAPLVAASSSPAGAAASSAAAEEEEEEAAEEAATELRNSSSSRTEVVFRLDDLTGFAKKLGREVRGGGGGTGQGVKGRCWDGRWVRGAGVIKGLRGPRERSREQARRILSRRSVGVSRGGERVPANVHGHASKLLQCVAVEDGSGLAAPA